MRPQLTSVEAVQKYKIALQFDDGTNGTLDLSKLAGKGIFTLWDQDELFYKVHISDTGAIAWNDDLDIDPLNAYLTVKGFTFAEWQESQLIHAAN
jgi:hypothetical protein